jgi:hypothetical protein
MPNQHSQEGETQKAFENNWLEKSAFDKASETYLSRELADRDSLLQFEIFYHSSLLFLNGVASTVLFNIYGATLGSDASGEASTILVASAAGFFVFGAISAIFSGMALARSRLRFMFLWGAKLRRHLGSWPERSSGEPTFLINDPGAIEADNYVDNISSEDRNVVLALRNSRMASVLAFFSAVLFSLGLLSSLAWLLSVSLEV